MPVNSVGGFRALFLDLEKQQQLDPSTKVDAKVLDEVVRLAGGKADSGWLGRGNLLPEEKVAQARKGLSDTGRQELIDVLNDGRYAPLLDPVSLNFLKAVAGLEPLRPTDSSGGVARVNTAGGAPSPAQVAVQQMRSLVSSGQLSSYYSAMIGVSGDAALKEKAEKLFAALPKITPATSADEMVAAGLWTTKPRGVEYMQGSPRYLPGRQVLVETTVHSEAFDEKEFLSYKEGGTKAITYRASLAGEDGDNFLVKVDGKDDPIKVPKKNIYALNQPDRLEGDTMSIGYGSHVDYNDPLTKAKVAEAAIKMDELVGKLDFTKLTSDTGGGLLSVFSRMSGGQKIVDIQQACVKVVHDVIDMKYDHGGDETGRARGRECGRLATKGWGVCSDQAGVMAGLLAPFQKLIGVDITFTNGGCYRHLKNRGEYPFRGGGHSWLQLTYRPSMELRICDRTWQQPNHQADRAYSRWGDRYPGSVAHRSTVLPVGTKDVDFTGTYATETGVRQFGVQGQDGRDNHQ